MGKRGPQPWKPTDQQIKQIRLWGGVGSTQENVATMLGISIDTLKRNTLAKEMFEQGKAEAIAKVAGGLVQKALNGDTTSAIFYLKTQAGWKETIRNENTGKDGGPIQIEQVTVDADSFTRAVAGLVARVGTGSGDSKTQH